MRTCRVSALAGVLAVTVGLTAGVASAQVKISQVWGGGGFAATAPNADFVELVNTGATAQDLSGWSIQVAAATSATWGEVPLPAFNLQPGQYFLVRLEGTSATGTALPTPDHIAAPVAANLTSTSGKVALLNVTTSLDTFSGCPFNANIVDFVGYGTTANCREGTGTGDNAPAGSTTAPVGWVIRRCNGFQDTNLNSADFVRAAIQPRNSSTIGSGFNGTSVASPATGVQATSASPTITTTITDCSNVAVTGLTVNADLSSIGGGAVALLDDGVLPDAAANDGIYTGTSSSFTLGSAGAYNIPSTITGTVSGTVSAAFTITLPPPPNDLVCGATVVNTFPFSDTSNAPLATNDLDVSCNAGTNTAARFGVWYAVTTPTAGNVSISETLGNDVTITRFDGPDCNTLTPSTCTDTPESISYASSAGQTTWFLISMFSATTVPTANYGVTVNFAPPAPNDTACTAEAVTLGQIGVVGLGPSAGPDLDTDCNSGTTTNAGVWYRLDATSNTGLLINETSSNDCSITVFTGPDCNTLTPIYCYDDTEAVGSGGGVPIVSGQSYWILVGQWSATTTATNYAVDFTELAPPANDACANATAITNGGSYSADVRTAGRDQALTCAPVTQALPTRHGVWFSYSTGAAPETLTAAETSTVDVLMELFSGSCAGLTSVNCTTADTGVFNLAPNTNYFLLLASASINDTVAASGYAINFTVAEATGACCIAGNCSILSFSACASSSGTFIGGSCSTTNFNSTIYSSSNSFPISIPDDSPTGATSTVVVTASGETIGAEGLAVTIGLTHTWVGDLIATISNGTITRTIMSTTGDGIGGGVGDSSNLGGTYTFFDGGNDWWLEAAAGDSAYVMQSGGYRASDALNAVVNLADFSGQSMDGTWTLFITDNAGADTGTITSFSIRRATSAPICPPVNPCPLDLSGNDTVDADDIFAFLNIWFAGPPGGTCSGCTADWDGNGNITADDIFSYLDAWFAFGPGLPCP